MPKYLVVSTSGNPDSNSRRMGQVAFAHLQKRKVNCDWLDIKDLDLPLCDADKCYGIAGAQQLNKAIKSADGILIAAPVYNYDVAAAAKKNFSWRTIERAKKPCGVRAVKRGGVWFWVLA